MTKDKLMQAVMRMRQLGRGHSVCFWGPDEVHAQLLLCARDRAMITSADIIVWTIRNTARYLEDALFRWAQQGSSFVRQLAADGLLSEQNESLYAEMSQYADVQQLRTMYGSRRMDLRATLVVSSMTKRLLLSDFAEKIRTLASSDV